MTTLVAGLTGNVGARSLVRRRRKRCDFLFVADGESAGWVAPIELKSGTISHASSIVLQLQGGADAAHRWLPPGNRFRFAPVLAHGKGIQKIERAALRSSRVRLRGHVRQPAFIRCGERLKRALE